MKLSGVPIFEIFAQFPDEAPKNLSEMEALIEKCRESNRIDLVEYLEEWVKNVKEKITQEWDSEV